MKTSLRSADSSDYVYSPDRPDGTIGGMPIWLPDEPAFRCIAKRALSGARHDTLRIFTLNPEMVMHGCRHPDYREVLRQGNFNLVDGVGVAMALRMRGAAVPTRLSGADIVYSLAQFARDNNRGILFIGGQPRRLQRACANLRTLVPGLDAFGVSPPYTSHLPLPNDAEISELILRKRPGVVIVCLGVPKQEQWIVQNRQLLEDADVRVTGGFGGTADFLSGEVARAPSWIRKGGLEWLYRLLKEPWRFGRQLRALPAFALRAVLDRTFAGKRSAELSRVVLYAHYMPPYPSASATRMTSLARHLQKRGVEVQLLTSQAGPGKHEDLAIQRPTGRRGLIRWLLRGPRAPILVSSPPATPAAEVAFVARVLGYRVVVDIRDPYVSEALGTGDLRPGLATTVKRRLERSLFRSAHVVAAVSEQLLEQLRATMPVGGRRTAVAPNGVDATLFRLDRAERVQIREQLGIAEAPLFVYAGILGGKNLDEVFAALAPVLRDRHAFLLMIAVVDEHSRPLQARLRTLAIELGISERVFWRENLGLADVGRHLNAADIGINPLPIQRAYCLPVKTYEYMACGLYNLCHAAAAGGLASMLRDAQLGSVASNWSEFRGKSEWLVMDIENVRRSAAQRAIEAGLYSRERANQVLADALLSGD